MTEDRKKLIAKFQKWLDTNPRKELIASQCANIAEEYHNEQSNLSAVGVMFKDKQIDRFEVIDKIGRAYLNLTDRPLKIEASLQDDGRTLKIFLDD